MNRVIRNLIRFIAAALFTFGALQAGLELMRHQLREEEIRPGNCIVGGVLLVGGVVLFAVSSKLADYFSDDDDDDNDGNSTIQIPPPET